MATMHFAITDDCLSGHEFTTTNDSTSPTFINRNKTGRSHGNLVMDVQVNPFLNRNARFAQGILNAHDGALVEGTEDEGLPLDDQMREMLPYMLSDSHVHLEEDYIQRLVYQGIPVDNEDLPDVENERGMNDTLGQMEDAVAEIIGEGKEA